MFPHRDENGQPNFRKHQFEVIRDTLEAFDDPCVDDVVVEAPTGAGKTSIAVTVARCMTKDHEEHLARARYLFQNKQQEDAFALLAPRSAHLITSMKLLQDAYLQDDPKICLVKGKGNYECRRNPRQTAIAAMSAAVRGVQQDFSCDDAEQFYGRLCENGCPYKKARETAQLAPIALHNFDSFLHQATLGGAFAPRRLLTVDEAHNTEEKIRSFMTIELTARMFEALDLNWQPLKSENIDVVTEWAGEMLKQVKERNLEISTQISNMRKINKNGLREIEKLQKLTKLVRLIESVHTRLERFHKSRNPPEGVNPALWVATIQQNGSVVLEPVDAGRFVPSALMRFGEKRLHLSATFLNKSGAYTRAVNLRAPKTNFISVPSTFPVENRLINIRSAGDLSFKKWDQNFPKAVERVREVLKENPGVRGVIHCTSYYMAEQFAEALKDEKRLFTYDKQTRDMVVNNFIAGFMPADAVLAAVSLTEGYDFKNDLCRFQILVRVPYPTPGKVIKARMEKDKRFYGWRTCLTLVQTYGRGTRSASDWCKTYVLDERFARFVKQEKDQLPDWFLEALA